MKRLMCAAALAMAVLTPVAQAQEASSDISLGQGSLRSSKWRLGGGLQTGINTELAALGETQITVDGEWGRGTRRALTTLQERVADFPDAPANTINEAIAARVAPGAASWQFERAFTAWFTFEGTDYDCVQIHVPPADEADRELTTVLRAEIGASLHRYCDYRHEPASSMTWGPYGATAGHGQEVQNILRLAIADGVDVGGVFTAAGVEGFDGFLALERTPTSTFNARLEAYLAPHVATREQRIAWHKAFARLGQMPEVRCAYERYAFQGDWLAPGLRSTRALYTEFGAEFSEVDFVFATDRIIHAGRYGAASRLRPVFDRLRTENAAAPANLLLRMAVAEAYPTGRPADRRGRDMVFMLDDARAIGLSLPQEWVDNHTARVGTMTAATFGLSSARSAPTEADLAPENICRWAADMRPY